MTANTLDWGSVAEAQASRIWAAAREIAPDDDAAWDCVQEAFLTGLRSPRGPHGDAGRWLRGVARNHARHVTRSRGRWLDFLGRFSARARTRVRDRCSGSRAGLTEALARLPARERDAVLLRYLGGMTVREVAAAQRVSEGAAKSRLRRGLGRLRMTLGPAILVLLLVRAATASPDPLGQLAGALATGGPHGVPVAIGAVVLAALGFLVPGLLEKDPPADPPVTAAGIALALMPVGEDGPVAAPTGDRSREWVYFDSLETSHGPYLLVRQRGRAEKRIPVAQDTGVISYLSTQAFGHLPSLAISLGDTNRVLIRPDLGGLRRVEYAVLVLRLRRSPIPPAGPFTVAVHRITEAWAGSGTTWDRQPGFEPDPAVRLEVDPAAAEVRVDLTELVRLWVGGQEPNHGILIKVAGAGAAPPRKGRSPRSAPAGNQWVFFESRETGQGPALAVRTRGGRTRTVAADADTLVISYLADAVLGRHRRLSVTLSDQTRVLLRVPVEGLGTNVEQAELTLFLRWSANPPSDAFEVAIHRVTAPWSEGATSWKSQPAFPEKPDLVARIGPEEGEVRLDVTGLVKTWISRKHENHGLLIKVAKPLPATTSAPARSTGPFTQPEIRTGTPFSDTLPWAKDIEEAIERAGREKKLVLATVVPIGDRRWVSGYRASADVWKGLGPHPWGDARAMAIDSGLVKERAMMASLFTDPEIVHLVRSHFVPVRVRPYALSFDEVGSGRYPDPLGAIGVSAREVGGPSLVFSKPDGTLVHACRRMGVFSVPMVRAMLRAVLEKASVDVIPYDPSSRDPIAAKAWSRARAGDHRKALAVLRSISDPSPEAAYLLAHLEDREGREDRARALWESAVRRDPKGPWGSKAAVRLMSRQGRLEAWESFETFAFDPLAERTEVDARTRPIEDVLERAVDFLLLAQRPDGSWRDPFVDVHPMSGPGSQWDKTVPRTGLVVDALLSVRSRLPRRKADLITAIERGLEYVGTFADEPQSHTWKLTYALHLQVAILASDLGEKRKVVARRRARRLIASLRSVQQDGGWSYMPPPRTHSFNTAPVLLLLSECRDHGVTVPREMTTRAAVFLEGLRQKDEPRDFAYASNVHHRAVRASSCRTALCELALQAHSGRKDVSRIRAAVDLFFEIEASVRDTTKVFESYFSPTSLHDAYHYYFGHYYVARALARLPKEEAKRYAARQREILLRQVELDGSFVDAQMQGKAYSTAMALLTLLEDLDVESR